MKAKITIEFETPAGEERIAPSTVEMEVPDFAEFTDPSTFGATFAKYERALIAGKNAAGRVASGQYLGVLGKKKRRKRASLEKSKSRQKRLSSLPSWAVFQCKQWKSGKTANASLMP